MQRYGTVCDPFREKRKRMKNAAYLLLMVFAVTLSSCDLIEGIFKAGVWTGLIAVALVLGLIIFFISRAGRK